MTMVDQIFTPALHGSPKRGRPTTCSWSASRATRLSRTQSPLRGLPERVIENGYLPQPSRSIAAMDDDLEAAWAEVHAAMPSGCVEDVTLVIRSQTTPKSPTTGCRLRNSRRGGKPGDASAADHVPAG